MSKKFGAGLYKLYGFVYYLSISKTRSHREYDMTATQNPTAIAMIEEMIADTELSIKTTEGNIAQAVATLQMRTAEVAAALEAGHGIHETGVVEAAMKVEKYTAQRTSLYSNLASLRYTLKAAGKE